MPLTLYALALAVCVMGTSEFMLAGLLSDIARDFAVAVSTAGLLTSVFAVGMVIGAPAMAAIARHWPPRRALIVCLPIFASCHVIGATTTVFPILLATRVLGAFANAGFLAVALSTAITLVPADRRGRALAILLSGNTVATVIGVPTGALLGNVLGWRATFWAIAALCIPAVAGVVHGVRHGSPVTAADARTTPAFAAELRQQRSPRLLRALTLGALINGGTFAAFTFLAPVVTDSAGLSRNWIPLALAVFGVGSFLGVTIAGRLSDRRPGLVLAIGGPPLTAGWVAMALSQSLPVGLILLVFLQGLLAFGVGTTAISLALHAATDAPTMGGSYATAALNIGAAGGPVVGGLSLSSDLGTAGPLWVAAALTGLALIVMAPSRPI